MLYPSLNLIGVFSRSPWQWAKAIQGKVDIHERKLSIDTKKKLKHFKLTKEKNNGTGICLIFFLSSLMFQVRIDSFPLIEVFMQVTAL